MRAKQTSSMQGASQRLKIASSGVMRHSCSCPQMIKLRKSGSISVGIKFFTPFCALVMNEGGRAHN